MVPRATPPYAVPVSYTHLDVYKRQLLKNMHIHAAYAHLFMDDPALNRKGATSDILIGQYSEQTNLGGLQLDWRF